jgi:hypothetical protein
MKHYRHEWDVDATGIKFDSELNIDKLGWKGGDIFEIVNINGQAMLRKIDPVLAFSKGHKVNCDE